MKGHPLQNFKSMYLVNGYRFAKDDEPIMSFQTDFNGTWNPFIQLSSGTLRWIVDGVEQITNNPSYNLVGNTVDVEVYANDVLVGGVATNIDFVEKNIIGTLDFSYFTINGELRVNDNTGLTNILFSPFANTISTIIVARCNFTSLDFSNIQFVGIGSVNFYQNSSLSSVIFSSSNVSSVFNGYDCALTSLDVSSFTFSNVFDIQNNTLLSSLNLGSNNHAFGTFRVRNTGLTTLSLNNSTINGIFETAQSGSLSSINFGANSHTFSQFRIFSCTSLTSIDISNSIVNGTFLTFGCTSLASMVFNSSGNTCTQFWAYSCSLSSLDLTGFTSISGLFYVYANSNLSSISFNNGASNTATAMLFYDCNFSTIDFSSFAISGQFRGENNPLTSITYSASNTASNFRLRSTNLASMDLSSWTMTGDLLIDGNTLLTSITQPTITTGLFRYWVSGCALPTAQIDAFFNFLNVFFSANAPIKDLDTQANGGTNGIPTGGEANADILNLDTVVYPNAGFDFTYLINAA